MQYIMFIVSENTTTCLRVNYCEDVKDFLNKLRGEHFGRCMNEIINQVESCIDEWNEEMRFISIDVCVDDTKFNVHIAEC